MNRFITEVNEAFHSLMNQDSKILFIGEDVLDPYGGAFKASKGLSTKFANQVYTTPISEGALAGIGAGLSIQGFFPVIEIMFGDFTSLTFDQLLNGISKFPLMYNNQITCPVTIRTPMGGGRGYGPTHSQSLEKYLIGIPNLLVVAPSIYCNIKDFYKNAIYNSRPTFIVENKLMYSEFLRTPVNGRFEELYTREYNGDFPAIGLSYCGFNKIDITLLTYAGMTHVALKAAELLFLEEELSVEVINIHNLSDIDVFEFKDSIEKSKKVAIVEEGTKTMGVGAEISSKLHEIYFELLEAPVLRIASPDGIIPSSKRLENNFLPNTKKIMDAVLQLFKS